jgi:CubicO group peptidase (beta-lactamase class C family)
MAKSIVGMLVGLAISDRAIGSVEDTADMYVPEFKGSEYGKTPIRDLLHMSSGRLSIRFGTRQMSISGIAPRGLDPAHL